MLILVSYSAKKQTYKLQPLLDVLIPKQLDHYLNDKMNELQWLNETEPI